MQEFTVQLFDDGSAQIGGTGANLELRFGYSKNAHIYSVKFIRSKEWEDLYIRVHFHPEADIYDVDPVLAQNNIVNIPAMVTSMPGKGKLTIEGTDGYKTITSADIPYRVSENSGLDSETDPEPGESSFQQFVDAVKEDAKSAEQAAKDAESALAETKEAASLALSDIETARTNAISDIEKIESEIKVEIQEDVDSAKSSAEAASKSAEEAKSAADSAKKSLSDLETAKESALSDISKEKDNSVSAIGSAKEAALNEISTSGNSAIQNVKTAETNAIDAVKAEGSSQKTALSNASNAALTSIDSAKQGAVKAVEDKASEESSAIDEKAAQVIQSVQNAGDAEISEISEATTSSIEQITQSAGQHLTQIDSAADEAVTDIMNAKEDSISELEAVNAHPPIQNSETGKWQVYNSETASYVDTEYDWEGGYYSPSVDSEGNLTWESSKEGMEDIPSSNIRGPQGLGVPTPTANDYGKAPTVNAAGNGYELTGPYAPLSAAIIETAKGNPAVCEDSVEWPLQGMRVYGKSTQFTTTGKNLLNISEMQTKTVKGITFELSNGGIYVHGTATAVVDSPTFDLKLNPGTYISNINESKYSWMDSVSYVVKQSNDNLYWNDAGIAFTVKDDDEGLYFYFAVANGSTVDEIIYPQIELGSTATDYEPYTGGKPSPSPEYPQEIHSAGDEGEISITLSDGSNQSQILSFDTPNGLPGIPVDSGGNYTDAEGQQWICDEVDFACKVYAKRIGTVSISNVVSITNQRQLNSEYFGCANNAYVDELIGYDSTVMCDKLVFCGLDKNIDGSQITIVPGNGMFVFGIRKSVVSEETVTAVSEYLRQNPIMVIYCLRAPVKTLISEEEIAAYRELHTYDGTTVITPDDTLTEVEVDYIVKPKAYIEKKLTAIESRLNALEISKALEGE